MQLSDSITVLKLVGAKQQKLLARLGLKTIQDLLFYFPRRYEDLSAIRVITSAKPNEKLTIQAIVSSIESKKSPRKRMSLTIAVLSDISGSIEAVWFNQPYLIDVLKKNTEAIFSGKVVFSKGLRLILQNPRYEIIKKSEKTNAKENLIHTGRIVPVYPETQGITSRYLRFLVSQALPLAESLPEWIPSSILKKERSLPISQAVQQLHFPSSFKLLDKAQKRIAFGDLLILQLFLQELHNKRTRHHSIAIPFADKQIKAFVDSLPFTLTNAQRRTAWEIIKDLKKTQPMYRLLEGDVGSGKTVVAALAILNIVLAKYQSILLAPTSILAQQHFKTLSALFKKQPFSMALFTRTEQYIGKQGVIKKTSKQKLQSLLKKGKVGVIVGTHALLQEKVKFSHIALLIVDEQHRFGVEQRSFLTRPQKSFPHFLSMTATPIPRTLALTLYGDLSLSLLDELPPNRQQVETSIIYPHQRKRAYRFIADQIKKGRQAFVICPLIDQSDKLEVKSAIAERLRLQKDVFPELNLGLLHGKLKPVEKEKTMQSFLEKKIDILVATSVIEVGIDVPNATIIAIEGAERFGLAQLHQFRGRVGRSRYKSYCLVFVDDEKQATNKRLQAFAKIHNGFALAEQDLKLRGPGEFFGKRQSGLPDIPMASLANLQLIRKARLYAAELIGYDPELNRHPLLKKRLAQFRKRVHLE